MVRSMTGGNISAVDIIKQGAEWPNMYTISTWFNWEIVSITIMAGDITRLPATRRLTGFVSLCAMGRRIDPSWWAHWAISRSSQCPTTGVVCVILSVG